jgi:dTDP-4-dehydrorhamnose reductase
VTTNLVIGASGQIGEHLLSCLQKLDRRVFGAFFHEARSGLFQLDIRDQAAVSNLFDQLKPGVIYLPAARGYADYCQLNPDDAYRTNVLGTSIIVQEANRIGARLVFFSSDYVFDGRCGPYSESDLPNPICIYGVQKILAEHTIALHSHDYLIVRTTVVFSKERRAKNFVQRLINTLQAGSTVQVPIDQLGSPTYAPNLAEAVVEMVDQGLQGLYHVVGPQQVNRYDLALSVADIFGLDRALIIPVSTQALNQAAPRPLQAGMVNQKAQGLLKTRLVDHVTALNAMKELIPPLQ